MLIVGMISSQEEAFEIQQIAKFFVVANRFKAIGRLARLRDIKKRKLKQKGKDE